MQLQHASSFVGPHDHGGSAPRGFRLATFADAHLNGARVHACTCTCTHVSPRSVHACTCTRSIHVHNAHGSLSRANPHADIELGPLVTAVHARPNQLVVRRPADATPRSTRQDAALRRRQCARTVLVLDDRERVHVLWLARPRDGHRREPAPRERRRVDNRELSVTVVGAARVERVLRRSGG